MSPYCLIAIAGLCFTGPHVTAEVSNFGSMGYHLTVTADHYVVDHLLTDVIEMHDFRKSPRACVDQHCIGYHKHCEPKDRTADKGAVTCTYHLGIAGVIPDGVVTIIADSEGALADAEREVARIGEGYPLPFSLMTVRTAEAEPPVCPGADYAVCAPP